MDGPIFKAVEASNAGRFELLRGQAECWPLLPSGQEITEYLRLDCHWMIWMFFGYMNNNLPVLNGMEWTFTTQIWRFSCTPDISE